MGYPAEIPTLVAMVFTHFTEPGLAIWRFTMGGVFEGFPSEAAGLLFAVGANVLAWSLVIVIVIRVLHAFQKSN